ncbi:MAG: ion transporter [Candidatus Kapaibacterium sp.]
MKYEVKVKKSEEGVAAWCLELPGCASQGSTEEEAIKNITVAIRTQISVLPKLPEPEERRFLRIKPAAAKESRPFPQTWKGVRHYMHDALHAETPGHYWGLQHWVHITIASVIILSMISVILETEPALEQNFRVYFYAFEVFTVIIFSIEYILRAWSIVEEPGFNHPITGRLKYLVTPLALVDLIAVLPFFIPAIIPIDLRFVRVLRLIRLVRVMKLGHYSRSLTHISKVIRSKKSELAASLFILAILLLFASTIMYYVEHEAQPVAFRSIPAAFWWGIETLTTVGYGDVAPITVLGKVCAAIIAVLGIGLFGLPTAIIATGFLQEVQHKGERVLCDECKKEISTELLSDGQTITA